MGPEFDSWLTQYLVVVVQLVERQIVDLVVEGSSPFDHPFFRKFYAFVAQLDRVTDFESDGRGFEPLRTR